MVQISHTFRTPKHRFLILKQEGRKWTQSFTLSRCIVQEAAIRSDSFSGADGRRSIALVKDAIQPQSELAHRVCDLDTLRRTRAVAPAAWGSRVSLRQEASGAKRWRYPANSERAWLLRSRWASASAGSETIKWTWISKVTKVYLLIQWSSILANQVVIHNMFTECSM
jgi:hypothetical protein